MPTITQSLIFMNLAVFVLQMLFGDILIAKFALWPLGTFHAPEIPAQVGFQPWQLVTSAFLHAGAFHLGLNMFGLYMFGSEVERTIGTRYFLALYFSAVVIAACVQLAVVTMAADAGVHATLGASGGVYGVLLAFGFLFPKRIVVLLFPPIPMQARYFVVLFALFELFNGIVGTQAGVAHFAHLGGMVGGFLVLKLWQRQD